MRRILFGLPILILLTLVSCGDSAIFLAPVEEQAKVGVETIGAGSILEPGSEVPFAIARDPVFTGDEETADQLLVELLDSEGVLLAEQIYESVDQADELPPLLLPEIGEGFFILRTSYMDGEDLIETEDVPFFVSRGSYSLVGLSSFPARLHPDSAGLLSLNLDIPPGADPYLEWYLDEELIVAGYLSETGATVEARAPGQTGTYTARVNLFPVAPPSREEPVPAAVTYQTELLVSTDQDADHPSFTPERSYYTLHHFLGDMRDSGAREDLFTEAAGPTRTLGDPSLALEADTFGYALDGDDGFEIDGFVLPVQSGKLSPFSVSLRLRPSVLTDDALLFAANYGESELFALRADGEGRLSLLLHPGGIEVLSPEPVLSAGQTSVVTISVLPLEDSAIVQFYVDGAVILAELAEWDLSSLDFTGFIDRSEEDWLMLPGTARIAGQNGFIGIIDEFGVYFRDEGNEPSPDTGVFLSAMQNVYGDKLVYAEGFEATEIPEGIEVEGDARVETGRLVLGDDASALFPLFAFSSEELIVEVSLDAVPGSELAFYLGDSAEPLTEFVPERDERESADLDFTFIHTDLTLLVLHPSGKEEVIALDPDHTFRGLRLQVDQNGEEPAEIAVQSVVAWREFPQIPAALLEPEAETDSESGE